MEGVVGNSLPAGWICINEGNANGSIEIFKNTETGMILYTREAVLKYVDFQQRESTLQQALELETVEVQQSRLDGQCDKCWGSGHTAEQCSAPATYVAAIRLLFMPPRFRRGHPGGRTKYRCSRCGRFGHNIRSCHLPPAV